MAEGHTAAAREVELVHPVGACAKGGRGVGLEGIEEDGRAKMVARLLDAVRDAAGGGEVEGHGGVTHLLVHLKDRVEADGAHHCDECDVCDECDEYDACLTCVTCVTRV